MTHKALVVDDQDDFRAVMEAMLKKLEFEVLLASNAQEACQYLEAYADINFLFLDINMPEVSGFQMMPIVNRLKRDRKWLKVAIVTGVTSKDDVIRAASFRADAFLVKPLSLDTLREKIQTMGKAS